MFLLIGVFCFIFSFSVYAQQPTALFTASTTQGCTPLIVGFTDQSTNAVQWQWNLGNGATSVLQNPSATYFTPGTYTITLIVTSASGLKNTLIKPAYINVRALPQPNFTATPVSGCFPLRVQFTDNTVANTTATSWQWDFGDGATSSLQNPLHTYTSSGSFSVTLVVTNEFGCIKSLTKPNFVVVNQGVNAQFTVQSSGCTAPQTAQFTNSTTSVGPLTYLWNFGDGFTSTLPSPSHTYTANGSYTVRLIATNSFGCSDTLTRPAAVVVGNLNLNIAAPDSACANKFIPFQINSTPTPTTVSWNFGDGTTSTSLNPVKAYSVPGNYVVTLQATLGACTNTITKNMVIVPSPTGSFTANNTASCRAPLTVQFTSTSMGAQSYNWNFGDGSTSTQANPTHTYTADGIYTVRLVLSNSVGCTDTIRRIDYIKIGRPVFLPVDFSGCAPLGVSFANIVQSVVPIVSYYWDFGDGTTSTLAAPSHVFAAGTYNIFIKVTTVDGCTDSITVPNGVRAGIKPIPAFVANPLIVCARDTVSFTDLSTGVVDFWLWNFGDGTTSNLQNPVYNYNDTGYFSVQLIVGSNGCFDSTLIVNYIQVKPPIANFTVGINCTNRFLRTFTDRSIGADSWLWNFGDGTTSTQQNPVHTYTTPGVYNIKLTVVNNITGCDHTKKQEITIANDAASFTYVATPGCKESVVTFTADTSQFTQNYKWYFGDDSTGNGVQVTHAYKRAGSFTVSLVITDDNNCTDSVAQTMILQTYGPAANFSAVDSILCVQSAVTFTDLSTTDGTHNIVRWDWNYGDGTIMNNASPPFSHTYATGGMFNVTLVVTDSYGCKDTLTKNGFVTISRPMAGFTADSVSCVGAPISISNQSTGAGLIHGWDFGDGTVSTSPSPTHAYNADGIYSIKLNIIDSFGCASADTSQVSIRTPIALFSVSDSVGTCPPFVVAFTNMSLNFSSILWDFGNGSFSSSANPTHIYNSPGTYTTKLTVTSPGGCTASKTITVNLKGPSGSFSYTNPSTCAPTTIIFTALSVNTSSYVWDFNDGTTMTTTDSVASHVYDVPGAYVPKVIFQDNAGCNIAIDGIDTIYVNGVKALFETDTTLICGSADVQFTNLSVSNQPISSYYWSFGDGGISNAVNPLHTYTQAGTYLVKLVATTLSGCVDSFTLAAPIRIIAPPEIQVTGTPNMCTPAAFSFSASVLGGDITGLRWQWIFSTGDTVNTQNINSLRLTTPGVYSYRLVASNMFGCSDTVTNSFEVYGLPNVSAGMDLQVCRGVAQTLQATGAVNYSWSPALGLSCNNCAMPVANPDSTKLYVLIGTDINGCQNSDSVMVTVIQRLEIAATGGDTLCLGQSTILKASGAATYIWSPSTGLSSTTNTTVTASPTVTTLYTVIGDDGKNCFKDTAYVPVQVYPYPTVRLPNDTTIEIGNPVTIVPMLSQDVTSVLWQFPPYLLSTNYPNITVQPKTDSRYIVKVSNEGGCEALDNMMVVVTCGKGQVFIPNTFSPNADGANDVFFVRGTNIYKVKQMSVFNRWGEIVFQKTSINANDAGAGWDGRFNGQLLNPDVYVYMIEVICETGGVLLYKGNVTLVR